MNMGLPSDPLLEVTKNGTVKTLDIDGNPIEKKLEDLPEDVQEELLNI